MARVPDSTSFALSEVRDVIDDDPATAVVTSVTDNGGVARFNTSNTKGLDPGDNISLTGFTSYNGVYAVTALSTDSWIETIQGYAGDESGIWTATLLKTLIDCFDNAIAARFDPRYEGSKDRQSNFQNYGWQLILTLINTHYDATRSYNNLDGCTGWLFVACAYGLVSYSVNSSGVLSYKDTWTDADDDSLLNIWVADSDNFIFCVDGYDDTLRSFTYNVTTGAITYIDDDGQIYVNPLPGNIAGQGNTITGDDNKFVFFLTNPGSGYNAIITSEYDGSANIAYKTSITGALNETFSAIWYDISSGYLFTVGSAGLSIFSINQTTGVLTRIDSENGGLGAGWNDVWTDGIYAYVSTTSYGLAVFSWDGGGNLTFEDWTDTDDSSAIYAISGDTDNKFIYCQGGDGKVHIFTFHNGAVYCHGESTAAVSNMLDVHVPYDVVNVLAVARGTTGLSTYGIS